MKTIPLALAQELIEFASTEEMRRRGQQGFQLEGAVAAYNQLARNRVAYLADEVGMGKTYIALGVMGLLRHFRPEARILVIAPRENLQRKWVKELGNFVARNWKVVDNRVRSVQQTPAREAVICGSLRDLVKMLMLNPEHDLFLRMTSFSLWTKEAKHRRDGKAELLRTLPWIDGDLIPTADAEEYRTAYGCALNAMLPEFDLLVVDEGHNLKHGRDGSSTRNALLSAAFGHPETVAEGFPRYGPKVKRLLFLSATPFESDYADLWKQFDLFGLGGLSLTDARGEDPLSMGVLNDPDVSDGAKRRVVERFLIRRVAGLTIGGKKHTKNMYRREWRAGGLAQFDDPMALPDPKQRLVVGLVQKKVAEVLGEGRFGTHFQIGMLSSFESFVESATGRDWQEEDEDPEKAEEAKSAFDGRQTKSRREKEGVDSHSLSEVVRSYRRRFGGSLPHPKIDSMVADLSRTFETGEKALVFVRRIATMGELKARLDDVYNSWIRQRMRQALPGLEEEVERLFVAFEAERKRSRQDSVESDIPEALPRDGSLDAGPPALTDEGGRDSFFAWFFRGEGPPDVLSGAAFQKNRLGSTSSAYSLLFEDDLVSWLLGRPEGVLSSLAARLGRPAEEVVTELRCRAYSRFRSKSGQREGYPRLYVFEAYQATALELIHHAGGELASEAETILRERFDGALDTREEPPPGFPGPSTSIGIATVVTEVARRPALERALLPERQGAGFRERFVEREQRRELLSAMCRLGASFIDVYLLGIRRLGSFALRQAGEVGDPAHDLARDFVSLLEEQSRAGGFHAHRELSEAASAFEVLMSANFPEVRNQPVSQLRTIFARWLQGQSPVATPRTGALARLVRQFRMPGYPLVLVTTDILQEGEDLHTFCRKVVHYGITWTASGMEQRTGRVDRIGGLVQRRLDGRAEPAAETEYIQVYYPHLKDTVEAVQVDVVFERMNRFLRLMHRSLVAPPDGASRIRMDQELLALRRDVEAIREPLESAFPVQPGWLDGETTQSEIAGFDLDRFDRHLRGIWSSVVNRLGITVAETGRPFVYAGHVFLEDDKPQSFDLELRTRQAGGGVLLRCRIPIGHLDLDDRRVVEALYGLKEELGTVKVSARLDEKRRSHHISIEGDLPFDPETSQPHDVEAMLLRTARAALRLRESMFEASDEEAKVLPRDREMARLRDHARRLAGRTDLGLRLEVSGDVIEAEFPALGRRQRVTLDCRGNSYVFTSVVLDTKSVEDGPRHWHDVARLAWEANATTSLVAFGFDDEGRLVGRIEHPASTLDAAEFDTYVLTLLREGDRLEYALIGKDRS